jgi:transposase
MKELPAALQQAQQRLPSMLIDSLHEQVRRIGQPPAGIGAIECRLAQQLRQSSDCKAAAEIPGVGLTTATAVVSRRLSRPESLA